MKLISSYQAWWRPQDGQGNFWFTYFDGSRIRTADVNAESFSIILDILRNEKPVYGEHTTAAVTTQTEPTGEEEQA
jgi:hypothetical protein